MRLAGNVFQPGLYQWFEGMRLRDLVPAPELVKPLSDLNYVLIRREVAPNVDVEVLSADLAGRVAAARRAPTNVPLRPRDTVYVFNIETGRAATSSRRSSTSSRRRPRRTRRCRSYASVGRCVRRASTRSSPACASAICCAPAAA